MATVTDVLHANDAEKVLPNGWTVKRLYDEARQATQCAYAPYSGFAVGAALLSRDGRLFTAGNVENGSYGLTICAERAAVVKAISHGVSDFVAIAVAGDTDRVETLASCGACLQVLAEFDRDDSLLVAFPSSGRLLIATVSDLLPVRFRMGL
jgi:cytidine deaminase